MRVKRGNLRATKRKRLLSRVKGFKWQRKSSVKLGRTAALKAGVHAYRSRKLKKRTRRQHWNIQINAGARMNDISYSRLIAGLKKANIEIDRKMLADLAANETKIFAELVKKAQTK